MSKTGRNDLCPCGSGLKYKKCCLQKDAEERRATAPAGGGAAAAAYRPVIRPAAEKAQQAASEKRQGIGALGVLLLFSTTSGDAWLLEITGGDALQLSDQGVALPVVIEENPETTEVEWSHTYALREGQFAVTSYKDKAEKVYAADYPVKEIDEAIEAIRKGMPDGLADMVHV